jgi:hypothetical protein
VCCHTSGGLLPHLFTLAKRNELFEDVAQVYLRDATVLLRRRYIFCGTFRERIGRHRLKPVPPKRAPLALPGALPFTLSAREAN